MAKGEGKGQRPDPLAQALTLAARRHRAAMATALARHGLFPGQEQVLRLLAARESMSMGDVAEALAVRPPTASKMIARLAAQGLVERRGSGSDARVIAVTLSESGHERAAALDPILAEIEERLTDGLDAKDVRRLRKLLKRIARNMAGEELEPDDDAEE
jgi:DNA-binding MarR family transcriptional regulator